MPRLPGLTRDALPEAHRDVYDYLEKTRGAVSPGFSVLLNSPEQTRRIAHTGTYVRFESALQPEARELAAHASSTEMGNPYEQRLHRDNLVKFGFDSKLIEAIENNGSLDGMPAEQTLPARVARELVRDHHLKDETFNEARQLYGDQGVVDLIGNIGYYGMLACLHVALEINPPPAS